MKIFGFEISRQIKAEQYESVLMRLIEQQTGNVGYVTPDNCMESPTVHAIVTAISRRLAVTPCHVYQTGIDADSGIATKTRLPKHPVAYLLRQPNAWQSRYDYWQDAASAYVRWGRFIAIKGQGATGPIRYLWPVRSGDVEIKQDPQTFEVTFKRTPGQEWPLKKVHFVRGPARDLFSGDSPVRDVASSIALEIAATRLGNTLFTNGAVPLLIFKYLQGYTGSKKPEEEKKFVNDFQEQFSGTKRHKAMLLPKGLDVSGFPIENDKAQFIETRRYQRTVIAGAFGVPPHLVGDLERATFNNVEQQDQDFTSNVMQPVCTAFESAMERDLLTDDDRRNGIVIRFNLDSILRADFKSRQEGLQLQRMNGIINTNEWREREGMNPIDEDDGGDVYLVSANYQLTPMEPPEAQDETPLNPENDPLPADDPEDA